MSEISQLLRWFFDYIVNTAELLVIGFVVFTPLGLKFPCKASQSVLRRDLNLDVCFFIFRFIYSPVLAFLQWIFLVGRQSSWGWQNVPWASLREWPIIVQILVMLLIIDLMQYIIHRWTHGKVLWRFHAIHHSSTSVDWLSSARWHPVNALFHLVPQALVGALGFSSEALSIVTFINAANNQLAHANLNWSYGPLRYILASPVYHHWHHTRPEEGGEKNFAQLFSFYDLLFGTFYKNTNLPSSFGAPYDQIPENFIGQLFYPFRSSKTSSPIK